MEGPRERLEASIVTTCQVLDDLNIGFVCAAQASVRVHDTYDTGKASILSCDQHVPLARSWVRHVTRTRSARETPWRETEKAGA